jgi:hypothetical protein
LGGQDVKRLCFGSAGIPDLKISVVAVLLPGVRRLKEWAFAGLLLGLVGALYLQLSVGDGPGAWMPVVLGPLLVSGSFVMCRLRQRAYGAASPSGFTVSAAAVQPLVA